MIYTVTLNPACDYTVVINDFVVGEVNRIVNGRRDPGGKGINVSKVIASLGGKSVATGILGGATGRYISECLDKSGIEQDFVWVDAETRTNIKVVDPARHTNTDINAPGEAVTEENLTGLLNRLMGRAQAGDIVVLAGKLPAGAPDDTYAVWTRQLKEAGIKVFVDAEGEPLRLAVEAGPTLIKPNARELSGLLGTEPHTHKLFEMAANGLMDKGIDKLVVSRGGDGALFFTRNGNYFCGGLPVTVRSTAGAGDAMMAALAYGEENGLPDKATFSLAMAVSAAKVTCSGTQAPTSSMVNYLMRQVHLEEY